ncbi:hypothetical protein FRC03_003608 [Tulasnella sp. 419]|nr:hypothetical protein FRC03_003608 [Tulasnella sp. 419]
MSTISVSRRTGVEWDLLLNSNITGVFKPHPKAYQFALTALDAVKSPEQVAMVAAHAYDLEAAKTHGMKTICIKRPTEDMDVDVSKQSFDLLIEEGGLGELARRLGCLL